VTGVVGFVGLGRMGMPMALRLSAAGFTVQAFDAAGPVMNCISGDPRLMTAPDLPDVARGADAVILMLPDSAVVEQVVISDGLLDAVDSQCLIIDMSSSEPARTRALATEAAAQGVTLIDAPVSGGVAGATAGTLTIMVGATAAAYAKALPVLTPLGARVAHAGDVGSGHAIKALNNLMSAAHLVVASEALIAGRRFGLDPAVMLEIVNGSSGRSGSTETKWPRFVLPETYDSGFGMRLMLKDCSIALAIEHGTGTAASVSEAAVAAWARAAGELPEDADHTEIARWLSTRDEGQGAACH
jgi:3-hydroxyisobutyrate dehydrogenase